MTATDKTGGPAFPTLAVVGTSAVSEGGITVRDYFATHAPDHIPDWYMRDARGVAASKGDYARLKDISMAWRWHYADLMLAEREKGGAA